jgi:hypothetical protein
VPSGSHLSRYPLEIEKLLRSSVISPPPNSNPVAILVLWSTVVKICCYRCNSARKHGALGSNNIRLLVLIRERDEHRFQRFMLKSLASFRSEEFCAALVSRPFFFSIESFAAAASRLALCVAFPAASIEFCSSAKRSMRHCSVSLFIFVADVASQALFLCGEPFCFLL